MRSILFTFVFALISFVSFAQNFTVVTTTEKLTQLNSVKFVSLGETKGTRNLIETHAHCQCPATIKEYLSQTYQPRIDGETIFFPAQQKVTYLGKELEYTIEYKILANEETYPELISHFTIEK